MMHGKKFTSAIPPSKRHRSVGSRIVAGIIGIVGVFRAIAIEYRKASAAEETYRWLRYSGGADLTLSGLRRDQPALVIKRIYCGHQQ